MRQTNYIQQLKSTRFTIRLDPAPLGSLGPSLGMTKAGTRAYRANFQRGYRDAQQARKQKKTPSNNGVNTQTYNRRVLSKKL